MGNYGLYYNRITDTPKIHEEEQKFALLETGPFGETCEPKLAIQKSVIHLLCSCCHFHVRYG
jgi:hypothetical protein